MFGFSAFAQLAFSNLPDGKGVNYSGVGVYSYSGKNIVTNTNRILSANNGNYAYVGQQAQIQHGTVLNGSYGNYSYVGINALNNKNSLISANSGTYSYTGQSADKFLGKVLITQNGTYSYAGQSVAIQKSNIITASNGTYTIAGINADIGIFLGGWEIEFNKTDTWTAQSVAESIWTDEIPPSTTWN
tara:strand:- start:1443 stop:2003 length:561 start_codon:yes stop_codon:yes gene_type:complete